MKYLSYLFVILIFTSCINNTAPETDNSTPAIDTALSQKEEPKPRLPRFTPIDFDYFYGQWVLTDFFDAAKKQRRFWTVPDYPNSHTIQIDILEQELIFKGYHENGTFAFDWVAPLRLQAGDWEEEGDYYFLFDLDTINNSLTYTFMEVCANKDKQKAQYTFHRMPENDIFDVPDFLKAETLGQIIRENWLLGTYTDLDTKETIEITKTMIDEIPCVLETDYQAIGTDLDLLKLTDNDNIENGEAWLGYRWENDILYIHKMKHDFTEGGLSLTKGEVYRRFKRVE